MKLSFSDRYWITSNTGQPPLKEGHQTSSLIVLAWCLEGFKGTAQGGGSAQSSSWVEGTELRAWRSWGGWNSQSRTLERHVLYRKSPEICKALLLTLQWSVVGKLPEARKRGAEKAGKQPLQLTQAGSGLCSYQPEWKSLKFHRALGTMLRRALPQQWGKINP